MSEVRILLLVYEIKKPDRFLQSIAELCSLLIEDTYGEFFSVGIEQNQSSRTAKGQD